MRYLRGGDDPILEENAELVKIVAKIIRNSEI
jgi:hypothetical protein